MWSLELFWLDVFHNSNVLNFQYVYILFQANIRFHCGFLKDRFSSTKDTSTHY